MMIDTHAHVQFDAYNADRDEVIKRSIEKGTIFNLVGTQKDTSVRAVEVAEKHDEVYATVGLHPGHLFSKFIDQDEIAAETQENDFDFEFYKKLGQHPKTIAIGECGLDLYRLPEGVSREQLLQKQTEIFLLQIKLAKEIDLPVVVHSRETHEELLQIFQQPEARWVTGTMHCYTGNWHYAEQYLRLGFYLGFTGVITFPPQKKNPEAQKALLDVVKKIPEDRLLLETDCPYLSPVPYRGKRGEPWMIEATAQKIAELRGISVPRVLQLTTENARRLFKKIA